MANVQVDFGIGLERFERWNKCNKHLDEFEK